MTHKPILFVDHATALGGAERSLLLLMTHLDARWQPHLAAPAGTLADAATAQGIAVHHVDMPRLRRSAAARSDLTITARTLAKVARQTGAAALYSNTVRASFLTAVAARLARKPFVWHMRDFWLSENRPRQLAIDSGLKRLLSSQASRIITNSQAVADHLPSQQKVTVVHNGIDFSRFDQPQPDRFRQQLGIGAATPLVGTVGRLRPWKGQRAFIDMAAQLAQQHNDVQFAIVGGATFGVEDDYVAELHRLAAQAGLAERLRFTGALDNIPDVMAGLDVFVHCGEPEPFGLVNIEAMAVGTPVVAKRHGALPEIVQDGVNGLLVPPDDQAALAEAVLRLLSDPAYSQKLGKAGAARARTRFSIERTAAEVAKVLTEVTA